MTPTRRFTLETHPGPYESWPRRTRLVFDGRPTATSVPGYALLHQFELAGPRHLLVVDLACPWEEETTVLLLDAAHRVIARAHFGLPSGFHSLEQATPSGARSLDLRFTGRGVCRVEVLDARRRWFGSLLETRWIAGDREGSER